MRWAPATVAGFARAAGFGDQHLVVAVAVALAASGGDDAARYKPPIVGGADERGLWQIDVRMLPPGDPGNLYDPRVNAAWAHRLWEDGGRSWRWSPTWRAGTWRNLLPEAAEAARRASEAPAAAVLPVGAHAAAGGRSARASRERALAAQAGLGRLLRQPRL